VGLFVGEDLAAESICSSSSGSVRSIEAQEVEVEGLIVSGMSMALMSRRRFGAGIGHFMYWHLLSLNVRDRSVCISRTILREVTSFMTLEAKTFLETFVTVNRALSKKVEINRFRIG
jgi:hypothetical protein